MNKIILAYSGGLDTTVILKWLQQNYDAEVITYTADLGQNDLRDDVEARASQAGASHSIVEDLKDDFVKNYVFPMFRGNAIYEGEYLLGTSIARPLIAKRLVEIAREEGAQFISHGATGKGNDQIRFELGVYGLAPELKIISPWREWKLVSRKDLVKYCNENQLPLEDSSQDEPPFSTDENLLHISYEGGILEDITAEPPKSMWRNTKSLDDAPDSGEEFSLEFENGDPIAINDEKLSPADLLTKLNDIGSRNGIGRLDIVESRSTGMKSRGCYETPGGSILLKARRALESICMDGDSIKTKDELISKYSSLIYDGLWWSPERHAIQSLIDNLSENVQGQIKILVKKGNVIILSRRSDKSLYKSDLASFDEKGDFNQKDAEGYIKIKSLRLKNRHN